MCHTQFTRLLATQKKSLAHFSSLSLKKLPRKDCFRWSIYCECPKGVDWRVASETESEPFIELRLCQTERCLRLIISQRRIRNQAGRVSQDFCLYRLSNARRRSNRFSVVGRENPFHSLQVVTEAPVTPWNVAQCEINYRFCIVLRSSPLSSRAAPRRCRKEAKKENGNNNLIG